MAGLIFESFLHKPQKYSFRITIIFIFKDITIPTLWIFGDLPIFKDESCFCISGYSYLHPVFQKTLKNRAKISSGDTEIVMHLV